ncbi:MAG: hypothetical protein WCQ41_10295 [Bacillota bacterium]
MSQKYGAEVHIFDTLLRLNSLGFCHPPDLAADIGFDNLLTPTLKSDNCLHLTVQAVHLNHGLAAHTKDGPVLCICT